MKKLNNNKTEDLVQARTESERLSVAQDLVQVRTNNKHTIMSWLHIFVVSAVYFASAEKLCLGDLAFSSTSCLVEVVMWQVGHDYDTQRDNRFRVEV